MGTNSSSADSARSSLLSSAMPVPIAGASPHVDVAAAPARYHRHRFGECFMERAQFVMRWVKRRMKPARLVLKFLMMHPRETLQNNQKK
jgi:hypothetical protein